MGKKSIAWGNRGWTPVRFGFCPSRKAWESFTKKAGIPEPYPEVGAARITTFDSRGGDVVCLLTMVPNWREYSKVAIAGLVAHEAVHVWQEVRKAMREENPSPEFEAYSVQAIFQELIWAIEESTGWTL